MSSTRFWKLLLDLLDHPVSIALISFFLTSQLLAVQYNCRAWYVIIPQPGRTNESLARDYEKILDSMKTNESTYQSVEADKSLVMIGVISAQKLLDTRAMMIHSTWGKRVAGKVHYFSSAGSKSKYDLPLIALPGVDDSYPPQKKSFMMLKFMHDNYIDQFEWFMRMDDDVYIRPERLETFLRSLNSSQTLLLGQAGQGNAEEFGLLGLSNQDNFCMGGPGMIISRAALRAVAANISYCTNNMMTTHEDVEVGRCFAKLANISCSWNYEMSRFLRADYSSVDGSGSCFDGELLVPEVLESITLHPIKKPADFYRADVFLQGRRIMDLRQRRLELDTEMRGVLSESGREFARRRSDIYEYEMFDNWQTFSHRYDNPRRSLGGPWTRYLNDTKRQINEHIYASWVNRKSNRSRLVVVKSIDYGYMRHHPLKGVEVIAHVQQPIKRRFVLRNRYTAIMFREDDLASSSHSLPLPDAYRKSGHFLQGLLDMLIGSVVAAAAAPKSPLPTQIDLEGITSPSLDNLTKMTQSSNEQQHQHQHHSEYYALKKMTDKVINFVMPLKGRWSIFKGFMKNFERVLLADANERHFRLLVVLFEGDDSVLIIDEHNSTSGAKAFKQSELIGDMFKELRSKYGGDDDTLRLVVKEAPFSRSIGCETGAAQFAPDDLIFFVDVDMFFTSDLLARIRANTVAGKQVYYPIVFNEYNRDNPLDAVKFFRGLTNSSVDDVQATLNGRFDHFALGPDDGFWIYFGYGMVSVYNRDLRSVGGFNTSIVGWGTEDLDLYIKFIDSHLSVFTAVDPGLVHIFHHMDCDANLSKEQWSSCVGSKSASIASQRSLARIIYAKQMQRIEPPLRNPQ